MNSFQSSQLAFHPLLGTEWLMLLGGAALAIGIMAALAHKKSLALRLPALVIFALLLAGPSLQKETRETIKDVVAVIVDRSPSQSLNQRSEITDKALAAIEEKLEGGAELRVIESNNNQAAEETHLYKLLQRAFSDVPTARRAGAIFITDGQIHGIPQDAQAEFGPVHALLSGSKNERDRHIKILSAPSYGIAGQNMTIRFVVKDTNAAGTDFATVSLRMPDGQTDSINIPVNEPQEYDVALPVAGENIIQIDTEEAAGGELTTKNNRAIISVNAVRDRLRVLLVTGQPHAGGRMWRNLLTSDPAVDLIQFTILRDPSKIDYTPQDELSLIMFPYRELFEVKLYDFDLVIFDRYKLGNILPPHYFENIARYVQNGGAFLVAHGPEYAGAQSIFNTALQNILPAAPNGIIHTQDFIPALTKEGTTHPVTAQLGDPQKWAPWHRVIGTEAARGEVVMSALDGKPLVILDRINEGRVAQITSDHLWLWARDYQNGGPYHSLLRRTIHWLMKEPQLDERALNVTRRQGEIYIEKRADNTSAQSIEISAPNGDINTVPLAPAPGNSGWLSATVKAQEQGIYHITASDGTSQSIAVGTLDTKEWREVHSSEAAIKPLSQSSGGSAYFLGDQDMPAIKMVSAGRDYAGQDWIGLRRNDAYNVTGLTSANALPPLLALILLCGFMIWGWWREGGKNF